MTKCEKLFQMLRYIKQYPNLKATDLSRLCHVSERGVYRYLNTLSDAGIPISFRKGGYKLQSDYSDLFGELSVEKLKSLRILLSLGMQICGDSKILEHGKEAMEALGYSVSDSSRQTPREIEIVREGQEPVHSGGTITIGHSSIPDIINPVLTSETISVNLMSLIFSGLLKIDSHQRPVPDLARRWETSDDGRVWTFLLRKDAKFHDGHPVTAHDVVFTYRAIMDPANESPLAERYEMVERVEAEDDHIFRVFLKYPFAPIINWLNHEIGPKHLLEGEDLSRTEFNRQPVGSGPFRFKEWSKDNTIVLEANDDYFVKGRPIIDRLIFKAYSDRKAALQAISEGHMDIALGLTSSDLLFITKLGTLRAYSASGSSYYAMFLNTGNPIFSDIRVRKAMDYAIDKDSIVRLQLKGYSKVCTGPFRVGSWAYNDDIQAREHDLKIARELLWQAGWVDKGDGILRKDGVPFSFSLYMPDISADLERIALAIKAQLAKIGIDVELLYLDSSEMPYEAILARLVTSSDPDYAYRSWHSSGVVNLSSYSNKMVDDLLELGRKEPDIEERRAIYNKIHKLIYEDCPAVFLASGSEFMASNCHFRDAKFSSMMDFLTGMGNWQIIRSREAISILSEKIEQERNL